jgi:pSer/pThr/pTyr-binding forkhead associated (FHA) protein
MDDKKEPTNFKKIISVIDDELEKTEEKKDEKNNDIDNEFKIKEEEKLFSTKQLEKEIKQPSIKTIIFDFPIEARLEVKHGELSKKVYFIDKQELKIGRAGSNDVVLADKDSSREHCKIVKENEDYYIIDLDSANGTLVNDQYVKKHKLNSHDKIKTGEIAFEFLKLNDNIESVSRKVIQMKDDSQIFKPLGGLQKSKNKKIILYSALCVAVILAIILYTFKPEHDKEETRIIQNEKIEKEKELARRISFLVTDAKNLFESNKFKESIEKFNQILKIDPDNSEAISLRDKAIAALSLQEEIQNKSKEEIEKSELEKKIELAEEKALSLYNEQNYKESLAAFKELKKIDPQSEIAAKYLPLLEELTSEEYTKKLKKGKDETLIGEQINLAKGYYEEGRIKDAMKELNDIKNYENLDQQTRKDIDKIIAIWDKELINRLAPKLQNAISSFENGDYVIARNLIEEILNEYPDYKEAKSTHERIMDRITKEVQQLYRDGMVYEEADDIDTAISHYEKVMSLAKSTDEYYIKASEKLTRLKGNK